MRNQNSLFNHVTTFINSINEGEIFQVSELINAVGPYELQTRWKTWNNNPYYTTRSYLSYIKYAKFVTRIAQGKYRVEKNIPDWLDIGHILFLRGYHYDNPCYKGMTKQDILFKLEGKSQVKIKVEVRSTIAKLYSHNRNVYEQAIKLMVPNRIFKTQNSLYCFIEDIKNPTLSKYRKDTTPYYAGDKNYGPIIAHLIADGYLVFIGYSNNRKSFKVTEKAPNEPIKIFHPVKNEEVKNYFVDVNKTNISILAGEDSKLGFNFGTQSNSMKPQIETIKLAVAEIHLTNAAISLRAIDTLDVHMNARIYNLIALTQDILAAVTDKKDFLINQ